MKHMNKITALLLALILVLAPCAGVLAEENAAPADWEQLPIGTTGYAIKAPAGYVDIGVTDEEFVLGMVSSFVNSDTDIDIDVSQFLPAAEGFEAFATAQCEMYNGTEFTMNEFNGVQAAGYRTEWIVNDEIYYNATVLFDAGAYYGEIDFNWFASAGDKSEECAQILRTFGKAETETVRLGSSPYVVYVTKGYYNGEVTSEEAAEGLINYYVNDNLLFDFDVYENAADESLSLADVALQLCTVNKGSELVQRSFNGIPAYTFCGNDEYAGVTYETVTCVFESTNGTYIAIVCWLDNEAMRYAAMAMLETLTSVDSLIPNEPMTLRIGSSSLGITLPTTFVEGSVSEEEFEEEGYTACYYSPYALFDIDLYQCAIADELATLEEFTEKDCADYNGTELALDEEINNIHVTSYHSDEEYDGVNYHCATYTFEEDAYYYQLCFYWTDEDAEEDVEAVMETLAPIETETFTLGHSSYNITVPASMAVSSYEDADTGMTSVKFEKDPLKFIVYSLSNSEMHYSLEEYSRLECEYYEGTDLTVTEINGVPVAYFYYIRTDEYYNNFAVLTYCIETGSDEYIDIDFYLNGYVSMYQALDVINSITK